MCCYGPRVWAVVEEAVDHRSLLYKPGCRQQQAHSSPPQAPGAATGGQHLTGALTPPTVMIRFTTATAGSGRCRLLQASPCLGPGVTGPSQTRLWWSIVVVAVAEQAVTTDGGEAPVTCHLLVVVPGAQGRLLQARGVGSGSRRQFIDSTSMNRLPPLLPTESFQ